MKKTAEGMQIWDFLMKKIKNPFGVAGLMGNLYAESSLKSNNLQNTGNKALWLTDAEYTDKVDKKLISRSKFVRDGYGYGLAQWTSRSRKENLYDYVRDYLSSSIGDLGAQLEYLWVEIVRKYPSVQKTLVTAKDIRTASDWVLKYYESSKDVGVAVQKRRAKYGEEIYSLYMVKEPVIKRYVKINRKSINVRTGPTSSYPSVGCVYKGEQYPFLGKHEETGWYRIDYPNQPDAWVTNAFTNIVIEETEV